MTVRHLAAPWSELIAPRIELAGQPAARRELPFRFHGQAPAGPFRVGLRILVGHVHDRITPFPHDCAARAERMSPARSLRVRPPLPFVVERHRAIWRREDERSGDEEVRLHSRKILGRGARSATVTYPVAATNAAN